MSIRQNFAEQNLGGRSLYQLLVSLVGYSGVIPIEVTLYFKEFGLLRSI